MNCYDCLSEARTTTTAVAVCSRCHVALCPRHLRLDPQIVRQEVGMGRVTQEPEARRALCGVCERAEH